MANEDHILDQSTSDPGPAPSPPCPAAVPLPTTKAFSPPDAVARATPPRCLGSPPTLRRPDRAFYTPSTTGRPARPQTTCTPAWQGGTARCKEESLRRTKVDAGLGGEGGDAAVVVVVRNVVAGLALQTPCAQVRAPRDGSLQVGVNAFLVRFCIRAAAVLGRGESDKRGPNFLWVGTLFRRPPSMPTSPEHGI